ncbi:MAG: tetratricopeptide repeat protein [bacterium]
MTKSLKILNDVFKDFDIRFKLKIITHYEISDNLEVSPQTFQKLSGKKWDADFVVMFSGKKFKYFSGKAVEKYSAMIIATEREKFEREMVIHEMGHLFGLPHVVNDRANNYMRMVITDRRAHFFVSENEKIIKMTRARDFKIDTLDAGLIAKRLPLLLKISRRYQTDHIVLEKIANAYFTAGDFEKALAFFLKTMDYLNRLNSNTQDSTFGWYQQCYKSLVMTYYKLDSQQLTLQSIVDKFQISPEDAGTFYTLGRAFADVADLASKEKNDAAIARRYWLESLQALQLAAPPPAAKPHWYFLIGLASYKTGDYQKAIEAFKHAIRSRPDYVESYYNLGLTYFDSDSLQQAVETFQQALTIQPDYLEAYLGLGNAHYKLKHWHEAARAYRHAIQIQPDFALVHFNLGLTYFKIGDRKALREVCEILQTLDENFAKRLCEDLMGGY